MRITRDMLLARGYSHNHTHLFAREWPDGCEVTEENVKRLLELGFDAQALSLVFLDPEDIEGYRTALEPAREWYAEMMAGATVQWLSHEDWDQLKAELVNLMEEYMQEKGRVLANMILRKEEGHD